MQTFWEGFEKRSGAVMDTALLAGGMVQRRRGPKPEKPPSHKKHMALGGLAGASFIPAAKLSTSHFLAKGRRPTLVEEKLLLEPAAKYHEAVANALHGGVLRSVPADKKQKILKRLMTFGPAAAGAGIGYAISKYQKQEKSDESLLDGV